MKSRGRRRARQVLVVLAQLALAIGLVAWLSTSRDAVWIRAVLLTSAGAFTIVVPTVFKWILSIVFVLWVSWALVRVIDTVTDDLAEKIGKAVANELRRRD